MAQPASSASFKYSAFVHQVDSEETGIENSGKPKKRILLKMYLNQPPSKEDIHRLIDKTESIHGILRKVNQDEKPLEKIATEARQILDSGKYCNFCFAIGSDDEKGPSTVKLQLCGRCKVVRYCSKEHQVVDWKAHKPNCKSQK